jgi:hypothetical protein
MYANTYTNQKPPTLLKAAFGINRLIFNEPVEGFEPPTRLRILITNQAESTAIRHWHSFHESFPNRDAKVAFLEVRRKKASKKRPKK